jgi:hypothetical protein
MKSIKNILLLLSVISLVGCNDSFLDLKPTDKVSADALFASEAGVKVFMANLYSQLPIEDFNFRPRDNEGFNFNGPSPNNGGYTTWTSDDNGVGSQIDNIPAGEYGWWEPAYKLNRDINLLFSVIPTLNIEKEKKQALLGEAYFMRAYTYFALARRYGGVPIITKIANVKDTAALFVPRSTEKATWDFVLANCDSAAIYLGDGDGNKRRATKWVALALKSRAALHAASLAKYWKEAQMTGLAVDKYLVGFNGNTDSIANDYYAQCISACDNIMMSGKFSLYKPSPATPDEAAENYRSMFEDPNRAMNEVIFLKGFTLTGDYYGSNQDNWGNPNQTSGDWPHPGRYNPTLDLVDQYESYSNPGMSSPVVTNSDGDGSLDWDDVNHVLKPKHYFTFDNPGDIFSDKDARLRATVILPGSTWKNTVIVIQGGLINTNGKAYIDRDYKITLNGTTYYTYGASDPKFFSGFSTFGYNMTRTGFGFKKFLNQKFQCILAWNQSTTDWIDFRYGEILLNYAEATIESGQGDAAIAAKCINDLRHRAAHTVDIPLTLENVLRERRVEMAFENQRYWDLVRRREFHKVFYNTPHHSLIPIFDLRSMKYIFVRANLPRGQAQIFAQQWYYKPIPGIGNNGLIQNPSW